MPRVNRDLQRRMAARRERERRQPSSERRYNFGTPRQSSPTEQGAAVVEDAPVLIARPTPRSAAHAPTHMPFSAFRAEYAYVLNDLRRVAVVIGSLLLILILLYFILPR